MRKKSAGILLYHFHNNVAEVLLVHPGGPFWVNKNLGAWSIPKGEFDETENPLEAARREVKEETGIIVKGEFIELTPVKQKGGKMIYAWAQQKDINPSQIKSNNFEIECPPKSGKNKSFPEIDKAAWFTMEEARKKIVSGQAPLLNELETKLSNVK